MTETYGKTTKERVFIEGQLVLKMADHVKRGMAGLSKFSPKWEGPFIVREAYVSGYYRLAHMNGTDLMDPINSKWLKRYYAYETLCSYSFLLFSFFFFFFPLSDCPCKG